MDCRLSIIIPIYNGEKTLKPLLDSIFIQDNNFLKEVLIVNDGSTDNLINMIQQYNNKKIILINKKHSNAGDSRNVGIRKATGEYIWFIDSDDIISNDALNCIKNKLEEVPDVSIIEFAYLLYDEKHNLIKDTFKNDKIIFNNHKIKNINYFSINDYPLLLTSNAYPWNKIYQTKFIKNNKLNFSSTIVHNDLFFKLSTEMLAEKISFINQALYTHCINKITGQLTQQKNLVRTESLMAALNAVDDFILNHKINKNVKLYYLVFKFNVISWAFTLVEKEDNAYRLLYSYYIEKLYKISSAELLFVYSSTYTNKQSRDLIKRTTRKEGFSIKRKLIFNFINIYYKWFLRIKESVNP